MENCDLRDLQRKYPLDEFNLLILVTQIIDIPSIQRVVVNIVKINTDERAKEIYYNKLDGKYGIKRVGLNKLASAAGIEYLTTDNMIPTLCKKCLAMSKTTTRNPDCNKCPNKYDVYIIVAVSVPKTDGSITKIVASKELRMQELKEYYKQTPKEYEMIFRYRTERCESIAYNRAIRAALSIKGTYSKQELEKPFAVAHLIPNLDNTEVKNAVLEGYRNSVQNLFFQNTGDKNSKQVLEQIKAGKDTIQI